MAPLKGILWLFVLTCLGISTASAANRNIALTVSYKEVNFADKTRQAITVNQQIPAPTLHFKQGDHVVINVHNQLDKKTSVHWHGIILPWQMDGVEGITQTAIPPGGVFRYEFTLRQAGTYWYHAHADTQEQEGLYGAFIIDPVRAPAYQYTKDMTVVLSDWSNTPADQIYANLKKEGDYYSPKFPLQPSLVKFIRDYRKASPAERKALIADYKMMQQMRMSIYDISDVAYDAYLLNGQTPAQPWTALVKVGDTVRLRFIGAAGSTIYRVKIPDAKLKIVQVHGNDIKPYFVDSFEIAPGETYDVLATIKKNAPYIIYAESLDTRGAAVGALLTQPNQTVDYQQVTPFPEPLPVSREMMANMMADDDPNAMTNMASHDSMSMDSQDTHHMAGMHMDAHAMSPSAMHDMNMAMPTESTIMGDSLALANTDQTTTRGTKYQNLTAAVKTNDPDKPIAGVIRMELFGYMDHFVWFINGVPAYKAKPITIEEGKRYRIIFTNTSMMRHPMHIHGHWFILRNGHGAYDPLLHTIEMAPGATAVADIDADASGQWFFHCHHLYHMESGMARVFQYETIVGVANGTTSPQQVIAHEPYMNRPIVRVDEQLPINDSLVNHPMAHASGQFRATFLDIATDPFNNTQKATFNTLFGSDYNKLQLYSEDSEMSQSRVENADLDIFYWHVLSQFWAIKGGVNYYYRPAATPYWQPGIGIEGLMPYFIETNIRSYYHDGSTKLDLQLSRDTQITNNFFVRLGVRGIAATKTVPADEVGNGLNQIRYIVRPYYRLIPGMSVFFEYEHQDNYGAYASLLKNDGGGNNQNTYAVGLSLLF